MKNMFKKGISPLIATVLVIGFTVALAAVILTWGTSFTKSIAKGTEETTEIQLACAQDVQFDVKAACYDDPVNGGTGGVRFIVENNGNRDIINFTARFKVTDTDVVAGETLSGISKFGLKTYTATAAANPVVNNMVVTDLAGNEALIREVTLVPVIKIGGKEVTCGQSIDSYAPAVEDSVLNTCEIV